MGMRVGLAGLLGGIVVFAWGALSHMALGLFDHSFAPMPDEAAFLGAVKQAALPPGTYDFPHFDHSNHDKAYQTNWLERAKQSGVGIVVRWPDEAATLEPAGKQLGLEFASDVLGAWIVALVVGAIGANASYGFKVLLCAALGLFAWTSQNASHWIWYHFAGHFELPELADAVISWLLAGLVVAKVVKSRAV